MTIKTGLFVLVAANTVLAATPQWPQFRGPNGSGVAEDARPPVHFGPGTNLLWKDKIITKAEWEASEAFTKDKFNADRFVAIRSGGVGDSTTTHVQWETTKGLSEMPSALYYRGRVHFLRDGGMWTIVEAKSGKRLLDRERIGIGGQCVASAIAANGRIYLVNESGTFAVLGANDTLNVLSVNKLNESVRATPAIAGNTLYVRSAEHLWAFGETSTATP